MSKRSFRLGFMLAALALLAPVYAPGVAPAQDVIDGGTFTLFLNEARIGEEQFIIRQERASTAGPLYRAGAEQNLKLDGQTMRISVALEVTGARTRPRRYEAEINGGAATSIVGTLVAHRLRLAVRSPRGEEMREILVRGLAAIVDRRTAHHYFFVWKLLGDETFAELWIINPRNQSRERYRAEKLGRETITVGEREFVAQHLVLTSETGATRHVWLENDRVMRVEVPDEGFVAVRSDAVNRSTNSPRGTR